jgi:hypothetical protein
MSCTLAFDLQGEDTYPSPLDLSILLLKLYLGLAVSGTLSWPLYLCSNVNIPGTIDNDAPTHPSVGSS